MSKKHLSKHQNKIILYLSVGVVIAGILIVAADYQRQPKEALVTLGRNIPTLMAPGLADSTEVVSFTPCNLTKAYWITPNTINPVKVGTMVSLRVEGIGDCNGKTVQFSLWEDDGALGAQPVKNNPAPVTFSGSIAVGSWTTEYQSDGVGGIWNPPEYFFNAQIDQVGSIKSLAPEVLVQNQPVQLSSGVDQY